MAPGGKLVVAAEVDGVTAIGDEGEGDSTDEDESVMTFEATGLGLPGHRARMR